MSPAAKNPPAKKPDIHFRLSRSNYEHLQRVAQAMDRSVAWLIEKIVNDWITANNAPILPAGDD